MKEMKKKTMVMILALSFMLVLPGFESRATENAAAADAGTEETKEEYMVTAFGGRESDVCFRCGQRKKGAVYRL